MKDIMKAILIQITAKLIRKSFIGSALLYKTELLENNQLCLAVSHTLTAYIEMFKILTQKPL